MHGAGWELGGLNTQCQVGPVSNSVVLTRLVEAVFSKCRRVGVIPKAEDWSSSRVTFLQLLLKFPATRCNIDTRVLIEVGLDQVEAWTR